MAAPLAGSGEPGSQLDESSVFDHPSVVELLTEDAGCDGHREMRLLLQGLRCAGCAGAIERLLSGLAGVVQAEVNFSNHRARLQFDPTVVRPSEILQALQHAGYDASPYDWRRNEYAIEADRRSRLRRLGVAILFGAQIMMLSVALYAGEWWGMDDGTVQLLNHVALLLCVPVMAYSATPFFHGAWRDLKAKRPGMDVPVTLGITIAFAGSIHSLLTGSGHVYFDSIAMFVAFLLVARHLEFSVRRRNGQAMEHLVSAIPTLAWRCPSRAEPPVQVPAAALMPGDLVRVRPGEAVPADGIIDSGFALVNESVLTGEERPVERKEGQRLLAGSTLVSGPVYLRVTAVAADSVSGQVRRQVEQTMSSRVPLASLSDKVAARFVGCVLLLAGAVGVWCVYFAPDRVVSTVVAILVATCPCALSLAAPSAMTAAMLSLCRRGVLVVRAEAVDRLARATRFVFDKTGTLTTGQCVLRDVKALGQASPQVARSIAGALERDIAHPVARAISKAAQTGGVSAALSEPPSYTPGGGVSGLVEGRRYYLGSASYVAARSGLGICSSWAVSEDENPPTAGDSKAYLADDDHWLACFSVSDQIRPGARAVVAALEAAGSRVSILSGDHRPAVERVAGRLGVGHAEWGLDPWAKQRRLHEIRAEPATVAMIGDGINDAPVLAEADISIAMASGAELSLGSADVVLINDRLDALPAAAATARHCRRIIRQNLVWAVAYNLTALPLAISGWLPPWAAALGMSLSSILVVLNSVRAGRR